MKTLTDYATPYLEPACEKALAIGLIVLSILGCILLALTVGDRDC